MRRVNEITNDLKYDHDFLKMFGVPSNFDERNKGLNVRRGRVFLGAYTGNFEYPCCVTEPY